MVKTLSEYKGERLEYGSQGGITGGGTTITILPNGQVFSTTTIPQGENYHGVGDIKEAQSLINEAKTLVAKYPDLNGTGNMTYFLVYHDGTTAKRISWSADVFPADDLKALGQKITTYTQTKLK